MVYGNPPWVFKGKAIYQLQLVKSEEARKYIPQQFKLVDMFGYTLGGVYLAQYEDSPAGAFDELVAMAGLVWNAPTSCAWAARVYVNNREARDHGIAHVGLPSRLASFKLTAGESSSSSSGTATAGTGAGWWRVTPSDAGKRKACCKHRQQQQQEQPPSTSPSTLQSPSSQVLELVNVDAGRGRSLSGPVCRIALPAGDRPTGPRIQLSLPSFSGGTPELPALLRYTCAMSTRVGLMAPLAVTLPPPVRGEGGSAESLVGVLSGRPLVTLEFAQMEMHVDEPEVLTLTATSPQQPQGWAAGSAASMTSAWAARVL